LLSIKELQASDLSEFPLAFQSDKLGQFRLNPGSSAFAEVQEQSRSDAVGLDLNWRGLKPLRIQCEPWEESSYE
jgi:hypothetical protein